MFSAGRCIPLICDPELSFRPTPATGEALWNVPRLFAGGATRLTIGRANERWGGTAACLPAPEPSIVVRVGLASTLRTGLTLPNSLGETLTLFRATGWEFTNVLRETAVNPLGARMLT
jgi:hypothetical protein